MIADGGEAPGTTPEQFSQHLIDEIARWRKVVQVVGTRVEQRCLRGVASGLGAHPPG